jgi:DNA replication factor GINS
MAGTDPLSYDEIHSIQRRERSTRSLTKVPHDFYERLAAYLADAKAGLDEESAKGASPRLMLLQGQFRNLQDMARDILLMRLRKVTEVAFTVVEGGALNDKVLSPEELAFAKDLGGLIERTRAAAVREGAPPPGASGPPAAPVASALASPAPPPSRPPGPAAAPKIQEALPSASQAAPSVVLLRILDDIPPFEGDNNRVYRLKREDVITLPSDLARILVRRKKAVELEVPP